MADNQKQAPTVAEILALPLHVIDISAQDIVQSPRKDLFLNLPHYGQKNILMIGSEECFSCIVSSRLMAGQSQVNMGCLVYKIDSSAAKNKAILTSLFGENYRIPKYYIELENTQLVPWEGNNLNVNQMCHDLQS